MAVLLLGAAVALLLPSAHAQAAEAAEVTRVSNAAGLKAALDSGVAHVVITNHLDLRLLPTQGEGALRNVFKPSNTLASIRVRSCPPHMPSAPGPLGHACHQQCSATATAARQPRRTTAAQASCAVSRASAHAPAHEAPCVQGECSGPPPIIPEAEPPLGELLPGQCVLATAARAFVWSNSTAAADVWLDRLQIRHLSDGNEVDQLLTFAPLSRESRLWLTRTSLIGAQGSRGFGVEAAKAFAQGARSRSSPLPRDSAAARCELAQRFRTSGKVWQPVNTGKCAGRHDTPVISRALLGKHSECTGSRHQSR